MQGIDLKRQVIGYGERTISEIVGAYINPDLPREWNISQLISKVKEFIYLLDDLKAEDINLLSVEELRELSARAMRIAYDLKESQIEKIRPGLMREAERFFILQQIDNL